MGNSDTSVRNNVQTRKHMTLSASVDRVHELISARPCRRWLEIGHGDSDSAAARAPPARFESVPAARAFPPRGRSRCESGSPLRERPLGVPAQNEAGGTLEPKRRTLAACLPPACCNCCLAAAWLPGCLAAWLTGGCCCCCCCCCCCFSMGRCCCFSMGRR